MGLKRGLGLVSTTLYGIGVILGAGIYALIAVGAGLAGNMLWLAFLISAVIAVFTALSYAELSSMFPKDAAEYTYSRKAFGREWLSFSVGWVLAIGTVIAASTVALGFGGYLHSLTGLDVTAGALALIALMTLLNYAGIQESARFNAIATALEMLGLLIVIAAGFMTPPQMDADLLEPPADGFYGIIAAVSVIFFAYIGFENVANLSEEVKDSRKTVPRALILALIISTIIYMLVAVAAVRELGWAALSESKAPLTLVVSRALGSYAPMLSYIALFATANTVLMFLIVPSRILYGMSKGGSLPRPFSSVGSRGTPFISVAFAGLIAASIALLADIKTVAQLADLAVFIAYFIVNGSLIALAGSAAGSGGFKGPRIAGIPALAYLGAGSSLFMLAFFPPHLWLMEAAILLGGAALFLGRPKRPASRLSAM
ncbi:amino acid permease [Candidatus Micrarchaeota archaeon]|nr:amino acid permease [Candidatus Micrarchaeota archaeon]